LELARAVEQLPGQHGMPGGSRYELKWDSFLLCTSQVTERPELGVTMDSAKPGGVDAQEPAPAARVLVDEPILAAPTRKRQDLPMGTPGETPAHRHDRADRGMCGRARRPDAGRLSEPSGMIPAVIKSSMLRSP